MLKSVCVLNRQNPVCILHFSTSQFGLATSQGFQSHTGIVATILDSTTLDCQLQEARDPCLVHGCIPNA